MNALAGQAAVSIENSLLYEDIERLFEGFVTAAVTAIEQRDPTTFGHSGRVATMTVGLAEVVDRAGDGPYRAIHFTREQLKEIRYAGLLHDFGKVGVREQVLVKAKKLYPPDLALIKSRYAFIQRTAEMEYHRRRADWLLANPPRGLPAVPGVARRGAPAGAGGLRAVPQDGAAGQRADGAAGGQLRGAAGAARSGGSPTSTATRSRT